MQRKGLEQDVITYSALISACAKGDNNAEKALQLLAEMQRKGLEPNVITYSALISACELLVEMQRKGLEPDVITHSALISACEEGVCNAQRPCGWWWRCSGWAWSRM